MYGKEVLDKQYYKQDGHKQDRGLVVIDHPCIVIRYSAEVG